MMSSTLKSLLVVGMLAGLPVTQASAAVGGRIGACKQDMKAKGLKGDEAKTFMKSCKVDARKACKEEAKSAGSDKADRHAFIKSCLKGGDAPGAATAPAAPVAPGSTVSPGAAPAATPPAPKP
ncbi:PsiF family protein [Methylobacterium sp. E-045]|uniref:PsiF family protein n=1 Tax=Methylobacterium sp. E-045 TaxID=2836575 RepID=UPI001FB9EC79|nr:PsiF family protein [Methylobacterium sp. E-045]MCJ2130847.1 PsiF family protein [Methylobacterium sp. E-045]